MYDFDVVFLLLSSPPSTRFDEVLRLHDAAANAGFHTVIATSPAELAIVGKRLRIIVVDGDQDSDFDVYAVTSAMRSLNNSAIVFLVHAAPLASGRGLEAGADICLPTSIDIDEFCSALISLENGKQYSESVSVSRIDPTDTQARVATTNSMPAPIEPCWKLISNGWVLCTPPGISLRLTATERDLMMHIFSADDKTVYHAEWEGRYGRVYCDRRNKVSSLSVSVGRLRRKCATLNIKLPLYVKRGRGYWFIERCRIVQEHESSSPFQDLSHQEPSHEYA